jgi:RNA polymerase sigma-70 factor (ECF subfamily)
LDPVLTQRWSGLNKIAPYSIKEVMADDQRLAEIEALYRERFRRFKRVAVAIVGDHDRAVEAVHDGFADAISGRRRFRGTGPLEAWVWRAVVNAALRARREPSDLRLQDEAYVRRNGRSEIGSDVLRDLIRGLPERQRLVLFLRYYGDLDYRSIAGALDVRTGTVSATLNAAHAALRRGLEEREEVPNARR